MYRNKSQTKTSIPYHLATLDEVITHKYLSLTDILIHWLDLFNFVIPLLSDQTYKSWDYYLTPTPLLTSCWLDTKILLTRIPLIQRTTRPPEEIFDSMIFGSIPYTPCLSEHWLLSIPYRSHMKETTNSLILPCARFSGHPTRAQRLT